MKMLNKLFLLLTLFFSATGIAWSAGGGNNDLEKHLGKVHIQLSNNASLQRGAKYFVNYCLSCHPAQHSRYKRVADDLGIPEDKMIDNLIFTGQKFGDLMTVAMKREDAKTWFLGVDPPDLSTHVPKSRRKCRSFESLHKAGSSESPFPSHRPRCLPWPL